MEANPVQEDMFEKAREAFFGTAKPSATASSFPAEFVNLRSERPLTKSAGRSPNELDATHQPVLVPTEASPSHPSPPEFR
jgi:hypothetical protein